MTPTHHRPAGRPPNLVLLRTFSKCYGLAGLRVGYALCSPQFRAAVDAVRQPFSVNASRRPRPPRRSCTRTTSPTGSRRTWSSACSSRRSSRELGLEAPDSQANFVLGRPRRPGRGRGGRLADQGRRRRPAGHALGGPGTSASPTAPAPRTSVSSPPWRTRSDPTRRARRCMSMRRTAAAVCLTVALLAAGCGIEDGLEILRVCGTDRPPRPTIPAAATATASPTSPATRARACSGPGASECGGLLLSALGIS